MLKGRGHAINFGLCKTQSHSLFPPVATACPTSAAITRALPSSSPSWTLNLNPEIVKDDTTTGLLARGTIINIKGGAYYPMRTRKFGTVYLGGEYTIIDDDIDSDNIIRLGARWSPKKNVTLDIVVLEDQDDFSTQTIPGQLILNVEF